VQRVGSRGGHRSRRRKPECVIMTPSPNRGGAMIRSILPSILVVAGACATAGCHGKSPPAGDGPAVRTELPARFVADRVVLVPTTAAGQRLELMTDSGGGMDQLYPATVDRQGLATAPVDRPGLVKE